MKTKLLVSLIASLGIASQVSSTEVIVNHLAPFANTSEGTAVSVNVNGTEVLTGVEFLQSSGYLELSGPGVAPGSTTLEVFAPPGADTAAISATVDLAADTLYSVTAIGDGVNQPLALLPLVDTQDTPTDGNLLIRVIHAAPFASEINATAASLRLDDGTVVNGLDNVLYGQDSGFFEIPAGNYDLNISTADGVTRLIDIAPIDLPAGAIVNVFATGDGVNQDVGAYAVFGDGTSTPLALEMTAPTRVNVAHLAPFADMIDNTAVSVNVNGAEVLSGVTYQQASGYLTLQDNGTPVGMTMLDVYAPPGAADPAISATVDLAAETDYTVVAIGDGVNMPLSLLPLVDDNSAPAEGNAKVRIVHSAPFSADMSQTAVSIRTDDGDVVGNLNSVLYGQNSGYLELPSALYDLNVSTPDGSAVLIDLAPLFLKDGDVVTVFAIGDGVNQDLGFYAVFGDGSSAMLPLDKELTTLNPGLNGSWADMNTPGQGFLIEVLPELNSVFVAWFTYDTEQAQDGETSVIGDPNHRWYTAQGTYDGLQANLHLKLPNGGLFNQSDATQTTNVGTLNLNFMDCKFATAEFDIEDSELSGIIPLSRITHSTVPFCQSLISE